MTNNEAKKILGRHWNSTSEPIKTAVKRLVESHFWYKVWTWLQFIILVILAVRTTL